MIGQKGAFLYYRNFGAPHKRTFSLFSSAPKLTIPPPPNGEPGWDMQVLQPLTSMDPTTSTGGGFFSTLFGGTTDAVQSMFVNLHEAGMPWWVSVIAGTAFMRTALFPAKVLSLVNSKRMNAATQEFTVRVAPLLQQKFPDKAEYGTQVLLNC